LTNLIYIFGKTNKAVAKKTALLFFKLWKKRLKKNECAVCALAFLEQSLMICTISRITGNG
tara:strand:+ start:4869 stop:5051 length:183 start_codon:yes stop_codon:yes gene_type:complete